MPKKVDSEIWYRILRNIAIVLSALMMASLLVLVFGSCTATKYVPVKGDTHIEKEEVIKWRTDTVMRGDTRFVYVKGDTVIDRRTIWRDNVREIRDTLFVERTDTIREPYPVERKLTRWEQAKLDFGGVAIGAILSVLAIAVLWLIRKFRR